MRNEIHGRQKGERVSSKEILDNSNDSESPNSKSAPRSSHCSTAVAESIREVAVNVPDSIHEDPRKIVGAILLLIDEICIEGEYEEQFDEWRDRVAGAWCELSGEHQWVHDHCGFWGHQFCHWCRTAKYPEIPGSCSKCGDLMKITESEYMSR